MRMTQLVGLTLRENPADADITSLSLLMRAGYLRPYGAGIFSYLHLGLRSLKKIEAILRKDLTELGGQEIALPQADFAATAMLFNAEVQSYKHLPRLVYSLRTGRVNEPLRRVNILQPRHVTQLEIFSLDQDREGMEKRYTQVRTMLASLYERSVLPVKTAITLPLLPNWQTAEAYYFEHQAGGEVLLSCGACGYTANEQAAAMGKPQPECEEPLPLEKVATPDASTIQDLANFLNIPKKRTAKAVFLVASIPEKGELVEKFVFAVVRGDMDVNECKLLALLGARSLRPANDDEIRATGAAPGYASPVGIKQGLVVVDDLIPQSPNLVAGANEAGFHLLNVNYGRDYQAALVADIVQAEDGSRCPHCDGRLVASSAVRLARLMMAGDFGDCSFLDKDSREKAVQVGYYLIEVDPLLACMAEVQHDNYGLKLPSQVAPFHVHIVALRGGEEIADALYCNLQAAGFDVLLDDRDERPGVKFNDADLIGCPLRLTVGERSLKEGGVELKMRCEEYRLLVPLAEIVDTVKKRVNPA